MKASLLISLYSSRSERGFWEQLDYNLLFRWFLGMNLVEPSFDATTFTKNRERLQRPKALFQRPNILHEDLRIGGLMLRVHRRTLFFSSLLGCMELQ